MTAFDRAQRAYDNRAPEEDGPTPCPECNGRGYLSLPDEDGSEYQTQCPDCEGKGWIDPDGNPVSVDQP